jgi:hypothetical protein
MGRTCGTYGERRGAYMFLVGKPKGKRQLKDLGVDGRITLKWILKSIWRTWSRLTWLRIWTSGWLL